jgi:hypothetical protein
MEYMKTMADMLEERMELEHARSAVRQILEEVTGKTQVSVVDCAIV